MSVYPTPKLTGHSATVARVLCLPAMA